MADRTIDIGYVHVGSHEWKNGAEQEWVCADNCPHPAHDEDHGACVSAPRDGDREPANSVYFGSDAVPRSPETRDV